MNNRSNKRNNASQGKPPKKKTSLWKVILVAFSFLMIIFVGITGGYIIATMQTLPSVEGVQPSASSLIYDVNGDLITTVHSSQNRLPVKLADTPKNLQNAFIAAEDVRFYSHHGIDPKGIARAIFRNLTHRGVSEGGSTITQQLARNAFLSQEQTLKRKINEALLSIKIEQTYTKPEILEMYMNQIYFGSGAYGVQAASQTYFGKPVKDLTLAQAALIAGLPNSPNYYNPFQNLKASKYRQGIVLDQMAKYGYITQEQANEAKNAPLDLLPNQGDNGRTIYSYFIDYVTGQVAKKYGDDALYKGGLKIYTTIDPKAQKAAVDALQLLPTFYTDDNGIQQPQGALIAINPHNGYIAAMVGGRGNDYFNRTILAERQPGSAFKPFVYLAALQAGMNPGTIVDDKKISYGDYTPQNYERTYSGKMTLRYALTHSVNTIAVQLANEVGMKNVIKLAQDMGITTLVSDGKSNDLNLAAALGGLTKGVTPIEMASAYGVLADGGNLVEPVSITKIVDRNGQILEENMLSEKRVVSEKNAAILTNMLQSVINSGTGGNANIGRPAAGKTGTTDDSKDAWFVGYTPNLSCAVWVGDDYGSQTLHGMTGGTTPARIWQSFMSTYLKGTPVESFYVPSSALNAIKEGYNNPNKNKDKDKDKDKNASKKGDKKKDNSTKEVFGTDSNNDSGNLINNLLKSVKGN